MQIDDVHTRELAAPSDRVAALLDGLGGPDDRLWPGDRWPTTPFALDGPLAVGTRSRQGQIRQTIAEYVPGRRVVFRFDPGVGLVGTHRLEIEPAGAHETRMTHTLACRVEARLVPIVPILRRQHAALVEDLLDRAELAATGRVARPARWPVSVRLANAAELASMRARGRLERGARSDAAERLARVSGVAVPAVLVAIAGLHAAWALGSPWPARNERELARRVLGKGERVLFNGGMPPRAGTWAVAAALTGGAAIVRAARTAPRSRALGRAAWGVASILLARGLVFLPTDLRGGPDDAYERLDLALYSPLCLALGAGTALVADRR